MLRAARYGGHSARSRTVWTSSAADSAAAPAWSIPLRTPIEWRPSSFAGTPGGMVTASAATVSRRDSAQVRAWGPGVVDLLIDRLEPRATTLSDRSMVHRTRTGFGVALIR